jgi:hypothetical protein
MILECGHCGAPLDVREGASITTCKYCGKANERQRMRTIAAETPRDFSPPPRWTPPAEFPAPSNVPLDYRRNPASSAATAITLSLVLGIGVAIVGAVIATRSVGGKSSKGAAGSVFSSGATPAMLAALNLNQDPAGIAKALSGRLSDKSVYVPLSDPRFEYASFSWDEKHLDHPSNFYLGARKGVLTDPRMAQVFATRLHGGLEQGSWNWFGGSGFHNAQDSASVGGHVQLSVSGLNKDVENPRWKEKLDAVWKVALEAAFAVPTNFSPADMSELLGAGHPLIKLASIDPGTTVEFAPETMKRLFPGSGVSTFISLDVDVSIEHPLFKHADMAWKNEKGGQLESVHFRPKANWASHREAFVACATGKLGKPDVRVADYVNKKQDYEFHSGQVRLLVPESMVYVVGYGKGILGPDWVKIVNAVNDCH